MNRCACCLSEEVEHAITSSEHGLLVLCHACFLRIPWTVDAEALCAREVARRRASSTGGPMTPDADEPCEACLQLDAPCDECVTATEDVYADQAYQDRLEGRAR